MRLFRKIIRTVLLAGILGLLIVFGFVKFNQPLGVSHPVQIVDIPPGIAFTHVSRLLHQKGLLGPEWFFQTLARVQRVDRKNHPRGI